LGKYFAVEHGNLYIFTTGPDVMLSLGSFPVELGLFGADTAWRVSPRVAVVEDVLQRQLESAQIVLRLHGYEKLPLQVEALEAYFVDGLELRVVEKAAGWQTPLTPITVKGGEED